MKAFICYLSDSQKRELDVLARERDRSRSEMIRRAIDDFLTEQRVIKRRETMEDRHHEQPRSAA